MFSKMTAKSGKITFFFKKKRPKIIKCRNCSGSLNNFAQFLKKKKKYSRQKSQVIVFDM